jgi:hypothetical protein
VCVLASTNGSLTCLARPSSRAARAGKCAALPPDCRTRQALGSQLAPQTLWSQPRSMPRETCTALAAEQRGSACSLAALSEPMNVLSLTVACLQKPIAATCLPLRFPARQRVASHQNRPANSIHSADVATVRQVQWRSSTDYLFR